MTENSAFVIHSEIVNEIQTESRKFKTKGKLLTVHLYYERLEENTNLIDIINSISETLNNLFDQLLVDIPGEDYVRISLKNEDLDNDIYIPFRKKMILI
jgi:hypothetical protein